MIYSIYKNCCAYALIFGLSSNLWSVTINMRDADIKSFVSDISSLTGKTFVVDPRIKANVTVISRDDLTIEEAYEIFLSVLTVEDPIEYAIEGVGQTQVNPTRLFT